MPAKNKYRVVGLADNTEHIAIDVWAQSESEAADIASERGVHSPSAVLTSTMARDAGDFASRVSDNFWEQAVSLGRWLWSQRAVRWFLCFLVAYVIYHIFLIVKLIIEYKDTTPNLGF